MLLDATGVLLGVGLAVAGFVVVVVVSAVVLRLLGFVLGDGDQSPLDDAAGVPPDAHEDEGPSPAGDGAAEAGDASPPGAADAG